MAFTQDFRTQRRNYNDGETRIGEKDRLWYDSNTNSIRISDGETPGGVVVGGSGGGGDYTLPTASTTTKGGVKVDGTTITITNQVISATQPDLSSYATQSYVTSRGYLTSVGTISYTDLSNKPTLFSGSYTDLTNKPTIPTSTSDLTNGAGYITSSALTGYATESYVTTRGYLTTYTETDPVFTASDAAGITSTDITNWGTAYSWGNHADVGYLTTTDRIVKVAATGGVGLPFQANVIADATNGVTISTLTGIPMFAETKSWEFDYDGNLTFPDATVQTTAFTGSIAYASVTGTPTLATVATSGSYTDLTSKPTIPAAQIQSDWNQATNTALDYIKNKPTIPTTVTVNGTSITLGSSGTVTAAAGTLTGTTLNSTVVTSSLTSVGTLTGLAVTSTSTTSGATITHTPATAAGVALTATGKDTQGGTGYFDFLRATNTTSGATNPSKTFRLNSTGGIEIINSAYTALSMSISDSGIVNANQYQVGGKQAVNGPAFRAYIDGSQTISSGSQQKVIFGTETFDTNANFASSRFTPTVEGYYQLNATVRISGGSGLGEIMLTIWKNGSEYARGANEGGTEQGASWYSMQVSDIAYANGTGDYFEIYIQQTSGGNRDTTAGSNISYFSGSMIRGA